MQYQIFHSGEPARPLRSAPIFLTALASFILISQPASAFDSYSGVINSPAPVVSPEFPKADKTAFGQSPSPSVTDSCLPLLKSIRQYTPYTVTDRNQRPAGKAATPDVVFGLRFALGATGNSRSGSNTHHVRFDIWQADTASIGDPHARAAADWRQCQKDQAVKVFESAWTH